MERNFSLAKRILGEDFIGPNELNNISENSGLEKIINLNSIPVLDLSEQELKNLKDNNLILLLVYPKMKNKKFLSLKNLKDFYGSNRMDSVGFYNQDWYINQSFYLSEICNPIWYTIPKDIDNQTRGKLPKSNLESNKLPSALILAYCFFIYNLISKGHILWKHDYLWCSDFDHNQDMIYVGRYSDPEGINNNGFSIHRHLKISSLYGSIYCNPIQN
tara:strand:- start:404 stop:1054 length:651 start_codon:yes stop_codon:yes gene_type:complete